MPLRPVHCCARSRVRPLSPALVAEYAACGRPPVVMPEDRADVDDRGPGLHHPAAGLGHPVAAVEVDVDDRAELLGRLVGGRHRGADAGVVDQHVDPAELRHRRVDERLALVGVGDVGGHGEHLAAGVPDQLRGLLEAVGPPGAEHHVGPGLGQPLRERDAEPAGGAGDDGDLAVQPEHVVDSHAVNVAAGVPVVLRASRRWAGRSGRCTRRPRCSGPRSARPSPGPSPGCTAPRCRPA